MDERLYPPCGAGIGHCLKVDVVGVRTLPGWAGVPSHNDVEGPRHARLDPRPLSQPWLARLRDFQGFTLAHPQLAEAKDKLMAAIQGSPPNSLVMVLGPTGVGKTTLKAKVEQILTQSLVFALQTDRGRIPVVTVEAVAPESGNFNWRDQFKRILLQMKEPLVGYKLPRPVARSEDNELYARLNSKIQGAEYRYAVEQALRYRRPLAVLIDEAQHLAKMSSGRKLLDQLDVIKSIANLTSTVHVLFGTYDLLAFHNLNGQLSRRSVDIHFRRYRADQEEDRKSFVNIVHSFAQRLPFAKYASSRYGHVQIFSPRLGREVAAHRRNSSVRAPTGTLCASASRSK